MLAKYLKDLRAARVVPAADAISTLGAGWSQAGDGALTKEFTFEDFTEASNFMQRYAEYCQKLNHTPQWSNVYNRVNVTLSNAEFGGVTSKEVQIGKYLDLVSRVTLHQEVEEVLSADRVQAIADIEVPSLLNDQTEGTTLYELEAPKASKATLYLTQ